MGIVIRIVKGLLLGSIPEFATNHQKVNLAPLSGSTGFRI